MSLLFGFAAVLDLCQALFQLNASHTSLPKPLLPRCSATSESSSFARLFPFASLRWLSTYFVACRAAQDFSAFSARFILSRSRNFIRALCSCDLLFPIEQPIIVAISLCSYPSTSCSTKIVRYPGGNRSTAFCNLSRSTDPDNTGSSAPKSFLGVSSSPSVVSSSDTTGKPFFRKCISTTLTAMRCNHVENADSPRNVPILRNSCRNASCVRSSASAVFAVMRRHSEYTRLLCRL